jgi:hypothetical protein
MLGRGLRAAFRVTGRCAGCGRGEGPRGELGGRALRPTGKAADPEPPAGGGGPGCRALGGRTTRTGAAPTPP